MKTITGLILGFLASIAVLAQYNPAAYQQAERELHAIQAKYPTVGVAGQIQDREVVGGASGVQVLLIFGVPNNCRYGTIGCPPPIDSQLNIKV